MKTFPIVVSAIIFLVLLGCSDTDDAARASRLSSAEFQRRMPDLVERTKKAKNPNSKYHFERIDLRVKKSYVADLTFLHDQSPTWESLVIRSNDVGLNTAEFETLKLIANLKSLQVPYISATAFRRLHELPAIEEFSLSGGGSFQNHLRSLELQIEQLPLTHLSISHTHGVIGTGDFFLRRLPYLESLDLAYTDISDDALLHLAALPNLKRLNISGTGISVSGLKNLFGSKSLEYVNAYHTGVTFGDIGDVPFRLLVDEK